METYSVDIKKDEEGYLGRECPECEKYFKIKPGTGIPDFTDCYCPYCQHLGPQDHFWTKQQIEYAQSVVLNKISGDLLKMMKKMETKPKRNQFISIGMVIPPFLAEPKSRVYAAISGGLPPLALWGRR